MGGYVSAREEVMRLISELIFREGSVKALANRLGISKRAVYCWLSGKNSPTRANLAKLFFFKKNCK